MDDESWPVPAPGPAVPSAAWQLPSARGGRNAAFVLVAVVTLLVVGTGLGVAALARGDSGPDHPDAWDPDVVELVEFVERERGLDFEYPVLVEFLGDDDFRSEVTFTDAEIDDELRDDALRESGFLRALGLAEGDVDLIDAYSQLNEELIIAFYDPEEERVVVRGTELTATTRVRLVHELVHALQDQHFDLEHLDELEGSGEQAGARTLIEGDATAVEDAYYETLSRSEQAEIDDANSFDDSDVDASVPEVLTYFSSAPYVFGAPLIAALKADGGIDRVDRAFDEPPWTEEHLLQPWPFAVEGESARTVDVRLGGDEEERRRDSFGAFELFMVLAERIDAHDALAAADGWGGGEYVAFEDDGVECLRAHLVGDTDRDTDEIVAALRAWADAGPPGAATVDRAAGEAVLRACDPGPDAEQVTGESSTAFTLPVTRVQIFALQVAEGIGAEFAWCAADEFVYRADLDDLNDETGDYYASGRFLAVYESAAEDCSGAF